MSTLDGFRLDSTAAGATAGGSATAPIHGEARARAGEAVVLDDWNREGAQRAAGARLNWGPFTAARFLVALQEVHA